MSEIYLRKILDYEPEMIDQRMEEILNSYQLNIQKSDKIVIKVNALAPYPKERGITTHPVIVESVIKYLKQFSDHIYLGDNPATKDMKQTLKVCGILEVCEKYGVVLVENRQTISYKCLNYQIFDEFKFSREFIECDYFFNLAKLKTHGFAYFTGCVKNLFGLIYGLEKASYHMKCTNPFEFSNCMCDLYHNFTENTHAKQCIHILDGILGLEKDGPGSHGVAKRGECLLVGTDPFSVDYIGMKCVQLNPEKSFIHTIGSNRKLGVFSEDDILIKGDQINQFDKKFEEANLVIGLKGIRFLEKFHLKKYFFERPIFTKQCVLCKECLKICPAKALTIQKNKMIKVENQKCTRCWCCQEICPSKAVEKTKRPLLGKIFLK